MSPFVDRSCLPSAVKASLCPRDASSEAGLTHESENVEIVCVLIEFIASFFIHHMFGLVFSSVPGETGAGDDEAHS